MLSAAHVAWPQSQSAARALVMSVPTTHVLFSTVFGDSPVDNAGTVVILTLPERLNIRTLNPHAPNPDRRLSPDRRLRWTARPPPASR